jgi:hypothetical protein
VILKVEPSIGFAQTAQAFVKTQQRAMHEAHFDVVASCASFNVSQCVLIDFFGSLFQFVLQNWSCR